MGPAARRGVGGGVGRVPCSGQVGFRIHRRLLLKSGRAEFDRMATPPGVAPLAPLGDLPLEQSCDDLLKHAFDQVKTIDGHLVEPGWALSYPYFMLIKDRLYRVTWDTQTLETTTQLLVPKSHREMLFHAADNNPMAGHLGPEKTLNRPMVHFYWPGIHADVRRWCVSCRECQLVNPPAIPKAPLCPLLLIKGPFERIGMDLVGPLERSAHGKRPRGILDILKEYREEGPSNSKNEIQYVLDLRAKLQALGHLTQENLLRVQERQSRSYNTGAWLHRFSPGDKVLVLLPTLSSKLLAKWQVPFEVTRQVGEVDYEVKRTHRGGALQVYHLNLLKPWREAVPVSLATVVPERAELGPEVPTKWNHTPVLCGDQLSLSQKEEVARLQMEFSDVFSPLSGLIEHHIETPPGMVTHSRPYHLPEHKKKVVQKEIKAMINMGTTADLASVHLRALTRPMELIVFLLKEHFSHYSKMHVIV
ncbi:hypothetical protein AOLI_G00269200 [Acnodon oligacanthus]